MFGRLAVACVYITAADDEYRYRDAKERLLRTAQTIPVISLIEAFVLSKFPLFCWQSRLRAPTDNKDRLADV